MIWCYDKRTISRNILNTFDGQTIIKFEEAFESLGVKGIERRRLRQVKRLAVSRKNGFPICFSHLHLGFLLMDILRYFFYVAKRNKFILSHFHSECTLYETLQSHLIKRIKSEVCLYMVIRFDGNFLLLFYIFADYFVFSLKIISFRIVTVLSVGLGLFVSILNYSLEFVSLKFIELSSWQGITIDEDTHQFLVIRNGEIVRLDYFLLESSLYLTVSERNSPCLLRN